MRREKLFSTVKFVFFSIFSLLLIFSAVLFTVLNEYKPVVKAYINQNFIGYFSTEQHFDEVYNELVTEKQNSDSNVKVYLESEPTFEASYIKDSLLEKQDVYTNLRSQVKIEYTLYNVAVNGENKLTFDNQDEANKYAEKLKSEVTKLNVEVESKKTGEISDITSIEKAEEITKSIIGENSPKGNLSKKLTTKEVLANVVNSSSESGVWPTTAHYISSPYGWRWGTIHTGTDIAGKARDPIFAYKSGTVTYSGWANSYGNIVKIDHGNGMSTWYAHNSKLLVKAGQKVAQGEIIALMGSTGFSTGNHLHFEVRLNGIHVNSYPYIQGK